MPKTISIFACSICGDEYKNLEEAIACERRGMEEPIAKVGDIVFLHSGFGWFDGKAIWVSNPKAWKQDKKCPNGDSNCFSKCCTYQFYYVVSAIERGHQVKYHVFTGAMHGRNGHKEGWTHAGTHYTPKLVKNPPKAVVADSKRFIGKKSKFLL